MSLRALAIICGTIAFVIFLCTATPIKQEFGEGVRAHEKCIANPDSWWCSLWGAGD